MPINEIYENGIVKINEYKYIKILKIIPINYNLKSDLEKSSILNSYKTFLKTCNFDMQILIQSNKEDLSQHISKIKNNYSKKNKKYLKDLSENYINYINKINVINKSSSKDFFIIISNNQNKKLNYVESHEIIKNELQEKYFKIKECLSRCGNSVYEINKKENILKLLYSFFNTRKYFLNIKK